MSYINQVKRKIKLSNNDASIGLWLRSECCNVVECLKDSGIDFIIVDFEQSWPDPANIVNIVRVAENSGLAAVARIYEVDILLIKRLLNIGFTGLHLAHIESAEQAKRVVEMVKYAPLGKRGYAHIHRGAGHGFKEPEEYREWFNCNTHLVAMIESTTALKNVLAIAQVEGIDVLQVGPNDLATSLGVPGQTNHSLVVEACAQVINASAKAGKYAGRSAPSLNIAKEYLQAGFRYISLTSDLKLLGNSIRNIVEHLSQ